MTLPDITLIHSLHKMQFCLISEDVDINDAVTLNLIRCTCGCETIYDCTVQYWKRSVNVSLKCRYYGRCIRIYREDRDGHCQSQLSFSEIILICYVACCAHFMM